MASARKLLVVTLQEKFLQRSYEQLFALLGDRLAIRPVSLNELTTTPPLPDETILYFAPGVRVMIERLFPAHRHFLQARREISMWNLKELLALPRPQRILVVNDSRANTEEMLADLRALRLEQQFFGYSPGQEVPKDIERIITSGEQALIPMDLRGLPVIDCGLRTLSLETVFQLHRHFALEFEPAVLARKFQQVMVSLSERWPRPDDDLFITQWFGTAREREAKATFADFVTKSPAMRKFVQHARKLAASDQPIHIYGEIGTGKKRICQAIHNGSTRSHGPFLTVNCATSETNDLERGLFGWKTADGTRPGLLEQAKGGTLCIEEIGALDPRLQARLLRTLTEGDPTWPALETRLITTSSTRLELDASRPIDSDLLLFLSRYTCRVPTLKERREDFETLVHNYLERHLDRAASDIDAAAVATLKRHHWKGNVQELYNVLQYMACTSEIRLTCEELPYYIIQHQDQETSRRRPESLGATEEATKDIDQLLRKIEQHGFLGETLVILEAFLAGKANHTAYGRSTLQQVLGDRGLKLTQQQLRLRLEKLNARGLLVVRPGRAGTTISSRGEAFLQAVRHRHPSPSTKEKP